MREEIRQSSCPEINPGTRIDCQKTWSLLFDGFLSKTMLAECVWEERDCHKVKAEKAEEIPVGQHEELA